MSEQHTAALLPEREAAKFLAISLSTIRRWRTGGILPSTTYLQIGSVLRYRVAALLAWIAEQSAQPIGETKDEQSR